MDRTVNIGQGFHFYVSENRVSELQLTNLYVVIIPSKKSDLLEKYWVEKIDSTCMHFNLLYHLVRAVFYKELGSTFFSKRVKKREHR